MAQVLSYLLIFSRRQRILECLRGDGIIRTIIIVVIPVSSPSKSKESDNNDIFKSPLVNQSQR